MNGSGNVNTSIANGTDGQIVMCGLMTAGGTRAVPARTRRRPPCSRERAAWWFDQMRRVVDEGRDFPVPAAR